MNAAGDILLLQDQDRSTWDRAIITRGMSHLARARVGETVSEFHLQAGIAACHCAAQSYQATDWEKILFCYDLLLQLNDSPIVALNRAVVASKVHGPEAGLSAVEQITPRDSLKNYYLYYAVLGELHLALQQSEQAKKNFAQAFGLTSIPGEQDFLRRRLRQLVPSRESS